MTDPDHSRAAWAALVAVFCAHVVAVLITTAPDTASHRKSSLRKNKPPVAAVAAGHRSSPDRLVAYRGLGSWVDLFNKGPWRNPPGTVRRMHRRGVRTIYLQTSTYGSQRHIVHPTKVAEFIASAHRRGMYVVAWSVPAFVQPRKDLRRAAAAIRFRTGAGEGFDSFGLDIEAATVKKIWKRNTRLLDISKKLRRITGPEYPLGAIIPDPTYQTYWPHFPYKRLARVYDVMVPMGYFTFRVRGYRQVREYTAAGIRKIRRETGDRKTPIHVIGGIADDVGVAAARGWIRAIKDHRVVGGSLYDFPITGDKTWKELAAVPGSGTTTKQGKARKP